MNFSKTMDRALTAFGHSLEGLAVRITLKNTYKLPQKDIDSIIKDVFEAGYSAALTGKSPEPFLTRP